MKPLFLAEASDGTGGEGWGEGAKGIIRREIEGRRTQGRKGEKERDREHVGRESEKEREINEQ